MPGWIGLPELLILLLVALVLFGPKRLPDVGRSLGRGIREFKDSVTGLSLEEETPRTRARSESSSAPSDPNDDRLA